MTARINASLWALYDFANSIFAIAFVFYFSQWLVIENGVPDLVYNAIFAAVSLLLLVSAPALARMADCSDRKLVYLNRVTVLTFAGYFAASLAVLLTVGQPWLAALCFLAGHYFYQLSFVFYNALLRNVSSPDMAGRMSGLGQSANWIGQIVGIALSIPFATGVIYLGGAPGRAQTLLPAVVIAFAFTLPFLIFFRLDTGGAAHKPAPRFAEAWKSQWSELRALLRVPGMRAFLLAYFFFMDALVTVAANFSIYLQNVFAVSDNAKIGLIGGTLFAAALFAAVAGFVADRVGLKRALTLLLAAWTVILPLQAMAPNFATMAVLQILVGGSFGAVWAVTRALMARLCPVEQITFGFSIYGLVERGATILGPLSWGAIVYFADSLGPARYRIALAAMTVYVAVGLILLMASAIPDRTMREKNAI